MVEIEPVSETLIETDRVEAIVRFCNDVMEGVRNGRSCGFSVFRKTRDEDGNITGCYMQSNIYDSFSPSSDSRRKQSEDDSDIDRIQGLLPGCWCRSSKIDIGVGEGGWEVVFTHGDCENSVIRGELALSRDNDQVSCPLVAVGTLQWN